MTKNDYHLGWILIDIVQAAIPPWYLAPFFVGHALLEGYIWYTHKSNDDYANKVEMFLLGCAVACLVVRVLIA